MKLRHKHKEVVVAKEPQINLCEKATNYIAALFRGGGHMLNQADICLAVSRKMKLVLSQHIKASPKVRMHISLAVFES